MSEICGVRANSSINVRIRKSPRYLDLFRARDSCFLHRFLSHLQPVFVNQIAVRHPSESEGSDGTQFIISHIDRIYNLKAVSATER